MPERRAASDPAVQQALGRKTHKYGAKRTTVDGIVFDSAKEARWFQNLRLLERAGEIRDLRCQPVFDLHVVGVKVAVYRADFSYYDAHSGEFCVEDVKGMRLPIYRLKVKMLRAEYGIQVREV